ncbi:MAG: dihydroneopterin aldolase [Bacteroidaceae bacterium]|nr:dihydroneopterin aldolase [Bacteroidaceae bacterium]
MRIKEYKIELSNIHLYAYHGVLPQENKVGGWYTLNLQATISNLDSIKSDNLQTTVNYAEIYEVVCNEMKIPSQLLEHVCGRILEKLFAKFESIEEIEISLTKDTPPMGGDRLSSSVRIKAER